LKEVERVITMEYTTGLFDIAAIWAIILSGMIGASGRCFKYSGLMGFVIGLFVGTLLISMTPMEAINTYTSVHINPGKSFVMQPLSTFFGNIFEFIKPG